MSKIFLINFDNLGRRYFQAILNLNLKFELSIIDTLVTSNKDFYKIKLTYFNKNFSRKLQICAKDFQTYANLINSKVIIYKKNIKTLILEKFFQKKLQ